MIFDLIAGMNAGGGAAAWTPADLFKSGEIGFWLDGSDYSTMSQSRTVEVAVTGAGQPVGQWRNKIAGQSSFNFVASNDAARPVTNTVSGKMKVVYDGVDDQTIPANLGAISGTGASVFAGFTTGTVSALKELFYAVGSFAIKLSIRVDKTGLGQMFGQSVNSTELYSVSGPNILGAFAKINTSPLTLRVNGVPVVGSTPTLGSISGESIRVVGTTSLYSEFSQIVFINRVLTTEEITLLETFIASKQ